MKMKLWNDGKAVDGQVRLMLGGCQVGGIGSDYPTFDDTPEGRMRAMAYVRGFNAGYERAVADAVHALTKMES